VDAVSDLLVEIGTEELPPRSLVGLADAFRDAFQDQLKAAGIAFSAVERFASPRRLALLVREIQTRQPDRESVRRGPAVQAAFTSDGVPTKAALGFASSCGVAVDALEREGSDKGEWLVFRRRVPGRDTASLVVPMAEAALGELPIAKRMRWGGGEEEFVRPVHWICILLGSQSIQGTLMGVPIGGETFGHRFHHPGAIRVENASAYAEQLRSVGFVEADVESRRERVKSLVQSLATEHGVRARIDADLLDEVTALVEWPGAILGAFDAAYLSIPPEVLIETMQANQKYFPLEDETGTLQAAFIAITNLESRDPAQVRAGNERVIRPRFADAAFFWGQDLKQPLEAYWPRLETVVFQDRLGTIAEKSVRVGELARRLAPAVAIDPDLAGRAARLGRCDLVTSMVFEFPALQGTMGRYYAERSGEDPCVCAAMEEQYRPRFSGDDLPATPCGRVLAIVDRIDSLVGIFGIGLRPSGAKDPYGLRRASLGVLRILIETPLDLDLQGLIELAARGYPPGLLSPDTADAVLTYMLERLRGYYLDRDIAADTIEAVLLSGTRVPADIDRRVRAVTTFRGSPSAPSLTSANKRIRNILGKAGIQLQPGQGPEAPPESCLRESTEIQLAQRVRTLATLVGPLMRSGDYVGVLKILSEVEGDLDLFFEQVMVMCEDTTLRDHRLNLLHALASLFLGVADLSRLQ
jgi:glycyl-tRNA synthetase beta chain